MKKSKIFMAAAMMFMALPMSAQTANAGASTTATDEAPEGYNRVSVGFNAEMLSGDYSGYGLDDEADDGSTFCGFNVQWVRGFRISQTTPLYLEAGAKLDLGFFSSSVSDDYYGSKIEEKLSIFKMSATVPVNVAYRVAVGNGMTVVPYTGLNMKFNIVGSAKEEAEYMGQSDDETYSMFDKDDVGEDLQWKRFQLGWQIGCGMNINKFYVGLEYGLDFIALHKKCNTSHFGINVGYNF